MRRRLLNLLTAISLLLCVAVVVLWVRSRDWLDGLQLVYADRAYVVDSAFGCVDVSVLRPPTWMADADQLLVSRPVGHVPAAARERYVPRLRELGVRPYDNTVTFGPGASMRTTGIRVHWFIPATLVALPPTLGLIRHLRLRRRHARPHACRVCCYDLRATPDRCPECGATP